MRRTDYGRALDELEALHDSGAISDSQYLRYRAGLLDEDRRNRNPVLTVARHLWTTAAVLALLAVAALLIWLVI